MCIKREVPSSSITKMKSLILQPHSIASSTSVAVSRPPNAFILYRQSVSALNEHTNGTEISKMAGEWWREESLEVRCYFFAIAKQLRDEHYRKYPDFQWSPKTKLTKIRRKRGRKSSIGEGSSSTSSSVSLSVSTSFASSEQSKPKLKPATTAVSASIFNLQNWLAPDIDPKKLTEIYPNPVNGDLEECIRNLTQNFGIVKMPLQTMKENLAPNLQCFSSLMHHPEILSPIFKFHTENIAQPI